MSETTTFADILSSAHARVTEAFAALENPSEDEITETWHEAIDGVIPGHNGVLVDILGSDLRLGYPDDKSVMEADDIFTAIRLSIRESLRDELDDLRSEKIRSLTPDPDDERDDELEREQLRSEFAGSDEI